ncbi:MAG: polysaccharide deacetylase family protein [Dehalococcoidia bacterium]
MADCTVCLSFDFDAISSRLFRGETTPTPMSRGEFGARVGVDRVLDLLREYGIRSTFYIPGHSCDTFPEHAKRIAEAGHELANHGYCHEVPATLDRAQEAQVLDMGSDAIERICGRRPVGYRSPSWDLSPDSLALLIERGFVYDSSLMADDYTPYLCRLGDTGDTKGPYQFGKPVDLVELPISWLLDDFPHFEWNAQRGSGHAAPSHVEEIWREEFEFAYERVPGAIYTLTMHPQVIGRGHRIRMLERLIRHMQGRSGVRFATMIEMAQLWRTKLLPAAGLMPNIAQQNANKDRRR